MKKIIAGCLFLVLCCSSVQAAETVTKTLTLGQKVDAFCRFIAYDQHCATIKLFKQGRNGPNYTDVVVRVERYIVANVWMNGRNVKVKYDGMYLHVSYEE